MAKNFKGKKEVDSILHLFDKGVINEKESDRLYKKLEKKMFG